MEMTVLLEQIYRAIATKLDVPPAETLQHSAHNKNIIKCVTASLPLIPSRALREFNESP